MEDLLQSWGEQVPSLCVLILLTFGFLKHLKHRDDKDAERRVQRDEILAKAELAREKRDTDRESRLLESNKTVVIQQTAMLNASEKLLALVARLEKGSRRG